MAKLVLSLRGALVDQFFLDAERTTVGRGPQHRIVIDDPLVSRDHAAVVAVGNDHVLEDLASANGTCVNGIRVARKILQHGDVVEFGQYHLRYLNPRASADADLERTMLVPGLPASADRTPAPALPSESLPLPSSRSIPTRFPRGRVKYLTGERSGETIELDRVLAAIGNPGRTSVVIIRRPQGYFLQHVDGREVALVNGQRPASDAQLLRHGDLVEISGLRLEFMLD